MTGDLVIEQRSLAGSPVLAAAVADLRLDLGGLVEVTGGSGLLVATGAGIVARAVGALGVTAPGFELGGSAAIELNTTGSAQLLSFTVGGTALVADVAAGASARVSVGNALLTVAGISFTADSLVLTSAGAVVIATGANLVVTIAASGRRVVGSTGASFAAEVRADGIALTVRGATVLGPDLGGDLLIGATNLAVDVNTSATSATLAVPSNGSVVVTAGTVRAEASGVSMVVLGATVTAGRCASPSAAPMSTSPAPMSRRRSAPTASVWSAWPAMRSRCASRPPASPSSSSTRCC